jgi:hypothetical protein
LTFRDGLLDLVGGHHGHGRPLWNVATDDDLPVYSDPMRDVPSEVTCRLGEIDVR